MTAVTTLFLVGTVGYIAIEGWSVIDALYMTIITLTTVGFGEVRPLSPVGRVFTIGLLILGVGTVAYSLSTLGEYLLVAGVGLQLRRRRMHHLIERLNRHFIVCGYGRVGQNAVESLREAGRDYVIVESEEEVVEQLRESESIVIHGDATQDEVLREAGIEKAAGLMVCTGSDPDNLFIVLSARALNPALKIVVRSSEPGNESKMRRAGADRVISPYQIGGRHMVNVMIRPRVAEFLDVVTFDSGLELWLEELVVASDSPLAGHTAIEADLRRRTGVTLVALVRGENHTTITPGPETRFEVDDHLIVLGTREQLAALEALTGTNGAAEPHRGAKR